MAQWQAPYRSEYATAPPPSRRAAKQCARIDRTGDHRVWPERIRSVGGAWLSDKVESIPADVLSYRPHGTTGAWQAMPLLDTVVMASLTPGTRRLEHDLRLAVPATPMAGTYSTSVTYTVTVRP